MKIAALFFVSATPAPPQPCKVTVDLVFLIDGSTSIRKPDFSKVLSFVNRLASRFTVSRSESHVGVAQFSTQADTEFTLLEHYSNTEVEKAVDDIRQRKGSTKLISGLTEVKENIFGKSPVRPNVPRVLVVMTDGATGENLTPLSTELQRSGINMFSVGIGDEVNNSQLEQMASEPKSEHMFKTGFDQLQLAADVIARKACPGNTK